MERDADDNDVRAAVAKVEHDLYRWWESCHAKLRCQSHDWRLQMRPESLSESQILQEERISSIRTYIISGAREPSFERREGLGRPSHAVNLITRRRMAGHISVEAGLESISLKALGNRGWSVDELRVFLAAMRDDFKNAEHSLLRAYVRHSCSPAFP